MNILLSNDDGYRAEGLRCLADGLRAMADIVIVAPDRNRSGASNSLTLDAPLRVWQADETTYYVNGTPTDCVHVAISGLLNEEPDMVISGINDGSNLGDDVLYSGTVAAAMEGRFLGLPAVAISLATETGPDYKAAVRFACKLVTRLSDDPLPSDTILNVNVPDRPYADIRGISATRLGYRHRAEPVVRDRDPKGRICYWVGPAGPEQDGGPGTDFHAVANGYISVTPLQIDLTRHNDLDAMSNWLEAL